jgi:hypothetical protein
VKVVQTDPAKFFLPMAAFGLETKRRLIGRAAGKITAWKTVGQIHFDRSSLFIQLKPQAYAGIRRDIKGEAAAQHLCTWISKSKIYAKRVRHFFSVSRVQVKHIPTATGSQIVELQMHCYSAPFHFWFKYYP